MLSSEEDRETVIRLMRTLDIEKVQPKEPGGVLKDPKYLFVVLVVLGLGGVAAIVVMARRRKTRIST